jgi:DNA polymerase epsilon subunit 2
MGTFVSKPLLSLGGREAYTAAFSALADIICSCPILCNSAKFLLVPGPKDYDICPPYPRKPIPEQFTEDLRKRVSHVTFSSNPCRLRFFTQEIVVYREDLLRKFQRCSIVPPGSTSAVSLVDQDTENENGTNVASTQTATDVSGELVQTIVHQGHLCPLPLHTAPIYWEYDHAFRLTPLPHLVRLRCLYNHAQLY